MTEPKPSRDSGRGRPATEVRLWFAATPELELIETEFRSPRLADGVRKSGRTDPAYRFSWTRGVGAVAAFLLRWAAWGSGSRSGRRPRMPVLEGKRKTPAGTLNDALTKPPRWLSDMFGTDSHGRSLFAGLVFRRNPDFKKQKGAPTSIALRPGKLSPEHTRIYLDGSRVTDPSRLLRMAKRIEEQLWSGKQGWHWSGATSGIDDKPPRPKPPSRPDAPAQPADTRVPPELRDYWESFEGYIREKAEGFVGRDFVFEAIEKFVNKHSSGYFVIQGDPGIGKSALLAAGVLRFGWQVHHFNIALESRNTLARFLRNICARLITFYELPHAELPERFDEHGGFLRLLLDEVSAKLPAGKKLVIAIDALDEAEQLGPRQNPLCLPSAMPKGVYAVMTTRPRYGFGIQSPDVEIWPLEWDSLGNKKDVRRHVAGWTPKHGVMAWMSRGRLDSRAFIDLMLEKSEGNFMYLRHVLPDIECGKFSTGGGRELPQGLRAYYRGHWNQMRCQDEATFVRIYEPVVCCFAAALESVSVEEIAAWTALNASQVREVVRDWWEFLHHEVNDERDKVHRVYHTAFREFLQEEVDPGLKTYHAMIAKYILAQEMPDKEPGDDEVH